MKWYKRIALVLACVMCLFCAACSSSKKNKPGGSGNAQSTTPVQPVSEKAQHYVEGGVHKVNVTETNRPFIVDGKTDYKIIVGADSQEVGDAVAFLRKYILKATGVFIPV